MVNGPLAGGGAVSTGARDRLRAMAVLYHVRLARVLRGRVVGGQGPPGRTAP
jgi:hypothetical protein